LKAPILRQESHFQGNSLGRAPSGYLFTVYQNGTAAAFGRPKDALHPGAAAAAHKPGTAQDFSLFQRKGPLLYFTTSAKVVASQNHLGGGVAANGIGADVPTDHIADDGFLIEVFSI